MRSQRRKYVLWGLLGILAVAVMVVRVGFWNHVDGANLEDVNIYQWWSEEIIGNHALPAEATWQYPPGAAFLFLIPRLGGNYGHSFVALMAVVYLAGLIVIAYWARRQGRETGVWVWLLAMPLLYSMPVLRFDLVPTVLAIGALVLIHRHPRWFGALVGLGAMIKVWPVLLLFGEWDRRRLLRAAIMAAAIVVLIFALSGLLWGNQTGFISNQDARGLQVESVAATPWQVRQMVTGVLPKLVLSSGTQEIHSELADGLATVLSWISILLLLAAAVWWILRERAIRGGSIVLAEDSVSRDFVLVLVLWFVVVSRVLSPQYLIWLVGLAAVVLCDRRTRIERPAWIVIAAVILTAGIYQSPANFLFRNAALVFAALDSGWTMVRLVRPGTGLRAVSVRPASQ